MSEEPLPQSWSVVRIEEITKSIEKVLPAKHPKKEIRYLDISGIDNKSNRVVEAKTYTGETAPSRARQLVREGDTLFSTVRTYLKNIARVPAEYEGQVASTGFAVLRPSAGILSEYLFAYTLSSSFLEPLAALQRGSSYPAVRDQDVRSQLIPLPPLAEQKRIVAKIEELFSELEAGEESLRVARRQLGVYRQSLLKQAFEGKLTAHWRTQNPAKLESPARLLQRIQSAQDDRYGANTKKSAPIVPFPADELVGSHSLPSEWLVMAYGYLCSVVRNGISAKPSGETGHKIARISAVRPMAFDYDDYRFLDCDDKMASDYRLEQGDLVFTRYNGARRFVGVCAQFRGHELRLYPDKLIRTRPDLPQLDPRYLEIALNCGLSRAWLETKIRTTAGQSGVSGGDVKAMPVPICSLPEQQEIVRLLDEQFEVIERNEREIDAALKRSEVLRQAILKKAITGRLVPQDPADEPAIALLARLRTERMLALPARRKPVRT